MTSRAEAEGLFYTLVEEFGAEYIADEIVAALNTEKLHDILVYIATNNGFELEDQD